MRSRKFEKTVKRQLCVCGGGKIFTVVCWQQTAGGAALDPQIRTSRCPECHRGNATRSMTDAEVAKARTMIAEQEAERRAKLRRVTGDSQ